MKTTRARNGRSTSATTIRKISILARSHRCSDRPRRVSEARESLTRERSKGARHLRGATRWDRVEGAVRGRGSGVSGADLSCARASVFCERRADRRSERSAVLRDFFTRQCLHFCVGATTAQEENHCLTRAIAHKHTRISGTHIKGMDDTNKTTRSIYRSHAFARRAFHSPSSPGRWSRRCGGAPPSCSRAPPAG